MSHLWNNVSRAFACCVLFAFHLDALPYDNEYGPDYGYDWIMFVDDNGTTNMLNFSTLPTDERGLIYGDADFNLHTRLNDAGEILLIPEDGSTIQSKYFNSNNDLFVCTHGWLSGGNTEWLQNMKSEFLKNIDTNVIIVNWEDLADNPIYPWSAFSTRYVGKRIAALLDALNKAFQTDERNIHLIGHSLGAQVMGYAGMFYGKEVNRITGLDPARPLFEFPKMGKDFRLDKTDAKFVDIIHTCGGIYGYLRSAGHADFYPNDGRPRQPGCEGPQQIIEACSHGRAYEFFSESINSTDFVAFPCDSWAKFETGACNENSTLMGLPASTDREGDFSLYTQSEPPYAKG